MRMIHFVAVMVFSFVTMIPLACATQSLPDGPGLPVAITHVSVIPMDAERVLANRTVLISEGRITEMGSSDSIVVPPGFSEIDGRGKYLLPGLLDMHAHASRREGYRIEDYLRQGVTGIRNMQGIQAHLVFREQAQKSGVVFYTAGQALAGYPLSKRHRIVTEPEEGRVAVREQAEAGYDYIKVYSFLSREVYDAIIDEARQVGIPVIGHVPDAVRARHAIASGQSSLEHFYGYFWELEAEASVLQGEWEPRRLFHAVEINDRKLVDLAQQTAQAGVWNCPTLWRKDNYLTSPSAEEAWKTPALRTLGHSNRMKLVKALHDAGAGLLVGTDDRAEIIHEELALFVEAGLTPYEALHAATVNAATYLGLTHEIGTVEIGKRANLVMVTANPLEDISHTKTIVGVMVNGTWIPTVQK